MTADARCLPSKTTTWLTPPWLLEQLGGFDLDPCCPAHMPWRTAEEMIQQPRDGLSEQWHGRVWLNPPYGKEIEAWMKRMAEHRDGVSLIFARTDTRWFQQYVFEAAETLVFLNRRVRFCLPDGTRGGSPAAPSVLAFYGWGSCDPRKYSHFGKVVQL